MVVPGDQFPDNFNIDDLQEPTPEVLVSFDAACLAIDELSTVDGLSTDPNAAEEDKRYLLFLDQTFADGSTIKAHSIHGSKEYLEAWGETERIRSIDLRTSDGSRFSFAAYTTGRSKLYIKKPGEQIKREVNPTSSVQSETVTGLSVEVRGAPDLMRFMTEALEERLEADRLGLTKPTNGSLREFTTAIQAAIDSGIETADE